MNEVIEETGVKKVIPLCTDIVGLCVNPQPLHIKRGKIVPAHLHFDVVFMLEACENDETSVKEDENSAVKWIELDKILELVTEECMKPIYKRMIEKTKNLAKD